jgi:3-methyl-2-oxobutanoate hydroxymethyltransferase
MPFLSYQVSVPDAIFNAGRFMKEGDVDAIKLEGGRRVVPQIEGVVSSGVPVMGHIGLTPQSSGQLGSFKAQGRSAEAAMDVVEDALAVEKAGVFAILVEAVPPEVGKVLTQVCKVPILGIGAGPHVDGQCLIVADMLGFFEAFTPKFVKKYANLAGTIESAFKAFIEDVKTGKFPTKEHSYIIDTAVLDALKAVK